MSEVIIDLESRSVLQGRHAVGWTFSYSDWKLADSVQWFKNGVN